LKSQFACFYPHSTAPPFTLSTSPVTKVARSEARIIERTWTAVRDGVLAERVTLAFPPRPAPLSPAAERAPRQRGRLACVRDATARRPPSPALPSTPARRSRRRARARPRGSRVRVVARI